MRKRWSRRLLAGLSVLFFLNRPLMVQAEESTEIISNIATGNVAISLQESEIRGDTEIPLVKEMIVVPGQHVLQNCLITNQGNTAWIRVHVSMQDESLEGKEILQENFGNDWIRAKDGCWYFRRPLTSGKTVSFQLNIYYPHEWSEEYSGRQYPVQVRADAVQTKNFTPDFKRDDPWFGTIIEQSVYDYPLRKEEGNDHYLVEYRGGAEGLVHLGDDLFANWGVLMPGDFCRGEVVIQNRYINPVRMYFAAEFLQDSGIAEAMVLRIFRGEALIYEGSLKGNVEEMTLGFYEPGDMSVFRYEIEIPKELNNTYALREAQVKWIWRTEVLKNVSGRRSPLTGDSSDFSGLTAAVCLLGLGVILAMNRKENRNETDLS